jgi:hypothetical protein
MRSFCDLRSAAAVVEDGCNRSIPSRWEYCTARAISKTLEMRELRVGWGEAHFAFTEQTGGLAKRASDCEGAAES